MRWLSYAGYAHGREQSGGSCGARGRSQLAADIRAAEADDDRTPDGVRADQKSLRYARSPDRRRHHLRRDGIVVRETRPFDEDDRALIGRLRRLCARPGPGRTRTSESDSSRTSNRSALARDALQRAGRTPDRGGPERPECPATSGSRRFCAAGQRDPSHRRWRGDQGFECRMAASSCRGLPLARAVLGETVPYTEIELVGRMGRGLGCEASRPGVDARGSGRCGVATSSTSPTRDGPAKTASSSRMPPNSRVLAGLRWETIRRADASSPSEDRRLVALTSFDEAGYPVESRWPIATGNDRVRPRGPGALSADQIHRMAFVRHADRSVDMMSDVPARGRRSGQGCEPPQLAGLFGSSPTCAFRSSRLGRFSRAMTFVGADRPAFTPTILHFAEASRPEPRRRSRRPLVPGGAPLQECARRHHRYVVMFDPVTAAPAVYANAAPSTTLALQR